MSRTLRSSGKYSGGGHDDAVGAGDRFGDQRGHLVAAAFQFDDFVDVLNASQVAGRIGLAEHAAVAIGLGHADHFGASQNLGPASGVAGRQGHGRGRAAVVGAETGDEFAASGELVTDFHGRFIGFGPAQGDKGTGKVARGDFLEHFGQHGPGLVGQTRRKGTQCLGLPANGVDDPLVLVADVMTDKTGTEIQPLPAVIGGEPHPFGRHHPER